MCPVAKATPLYTGPKYNGPQAERFRDGASVDNSLEWCNFCGICTLHCPQGVKIAELNEQAAAKMKHQNGVPLRDRLIPLTVLEGKVLSPIAPLANWGLKQKPIRFAVEKIIKVHREAPMPEAHTETPLQVDPQAQACHQAHQGPGDLLPGLRRRLLRD